MKILVSGKGGVGKTSIAALLSIIFSQNGYKVLALDTDSVPNLAQSLGIPPEKAYKITPLVRNEELIEERTGARPGEGWGLFFTLTPRVNDIVEKYGVRVSDNLSLVVVGSIDSSKEGCLCPAIALAKAFLLHVFMDRGEVIIVDAEAGAEVFGRGLAEKFDLNICVTEPTIRSMIISRKLLNLARQLGIREHILAINKVQDEITAIQAFTKVFEGEHVNYHIIRYDPMLEMIEIQGGGLNMLPQNSIFYKDVLGLYQKILKIMRT